MKNTKTNKYTSLISLVIAATFASSTAQADVVSSAFLGNISYVLTDLDDNDGITSSITFVWPTQTVISGNAVDEQASTPEVAYSSSTMQTGSANTAVSSVSSTFTGSIGANGTSTNSGFTSSPAAGFLASYGAETSLVGDFSLSANTQAVFTVDALTSASSGDVEGSLDYAYATSGLYGFLYNIVTNTRIMTDGDSVTSQTNNGSGQTTSDNKSKTITVTLINRDEFTVSGFLTGGTFVAGSDRTGISAVPVPAALPLMASALGLFGLHSRVGRTRLQCAE